MTDDSVVKLAVLEAELNALSEKFEEHRVESRKEREDLMALIREQDRKIQKLLDLWNGATLLVKVVAILSTVATAVAGWWAIKGFAK